MKAVIMAGGFGTRIQPLTSSIPKPMLPVVNIPIMEYSIKRLHDTGIKDFVILLYFKPEVIKDYFKDGNRFGIRINYVLPDKDYGTAGAVKQAEEFLDSTFIIVSGDLITDFNFQEIIDFHKKNMSKLTIGITQVENPLQFGVVITDKSGKIERFLEKPSWGEVINDKINTGIYVVSPDILQYIPKDRSFDFSKDLFPLLMEKNIELWGYQFNGYWRDVGNVGSYIEVHQDILNGLVNIDYKEGLSTKKGKNGDLYYGKNCYFGKSIKFVGEVVLGNNVYIGESVLLKNCAIGDNVIIKDNSIIKNGIIWNDVKIGEFCSVKRSVVCNGVHIGNRVDIEDDCVISEYCNIEDNVEILKGVMVWPHKYIESGAIVNRNVIWGEQYKSNLFANGAIEGTSNIELTGDISSKIAEAFGSIFPVGSSIYVGRDYYKSSRMVKRFIVGGLLSVGINVIDLEVVSTNVLRYKLYKDESAVGGVHVRNPATKLNKTRVSFFTNEGLFIDNNISKSIEKIYFSEKFRRVNPSRIGDISYVFNIESKYKRDLLEKVDKSVFLSKKPKIVVDLMNGMLSNIYPDLLSNLEIKSIVINAHPKEQPVNTNEKLKESRDIVSKIVKELSFDLGFILYPNGQKMEIVSDDGAVLQPHIALLAIIYILYLHDRQKFKIFLPPWSPDIWDAALKDIEIYRGRLMGKTVEFLKNFDFIGDTSGHYNFTSFGFHSDSAYASIKILELLSYSDLKMSEIVKKIPKHYFEESKVPVPHNKKAFIMRQISESAKTKHKISYNSGIRIYFDQYSWIFALPDDVENYIRLYVQSKDAEIGKQIKEKYKKKIEEWIR